MIAEILSAEQGKRYKTSLSPLPPSAVNTSLIRGSLLSQNLKRNTVVGEKGVSHRHHWPAGFFSVVFSPLTPLAAGVAAVKIGGGTSYVLWNNEDKLLKHNSNEGRRYDLASLLAAEQT